MAHAAFRIGNMSKTNFTTATITMAAIKTTATTTPAYLDEEIEANEQTREKINDITVRVSLMPQIVKVTYMCVCIARAHKRRY